MTMNLLRIFISPEGRRTVTDTSKHLAQTHKNKKHVNMHRNIAFPTMARLVNKTVSVLSHSQRSRRSVIVLNFNTKHRTENYKAKTF